MPHGYPWRYTEALEDALIARGWSQADLADKSGVSAAAISRVVNGKRVRPRTLDAICRALEAHAPDSAAGRFMRATA
jgi:DNA-binding Xre family transcriptional regulator